ncbi:glycosyltransferase [Halorhodospira halochloris]|uniref:glycosyltransferase n=1 Tax=Halorhodospira halochloris TaxID=1052 RepID=UPI001EE8E66A|nr:glycosyltransferase [Halorhodospira halochloris]MCG5547930.1 glycosyltransferase [Halorhodospira halochloris]
MRALICASGSHGDVLPFIALGKALQERNCEVFIYTHRYFKQRIESEGLNCIGVGDSTDEYQQLLSDPKLTDSHQGTKILAKVLTANLAQDWQALRRYILPGQTVAIGSTLSLLPRLLKETDGVFCVTTHLAPVLLRCRRRLPRFGTSPIWPLLPRPAPQVLWYMLDRLVFDPAFAPKLNDLLSDLGLPPAKRVLGDWLHNVDMILAMFPDWLANPQPPWDTPLSLAGFPNGSLQQGTYNNLPRDIRLFLEQGTAPVVFTPGTATRCSGDFFLASIQACQSNGYRGILVDAHGEAPTDLPSGMISSGYVPFPNLLPHAAALVHHGGIGTFSTALTAGIPQLIRPMAYDQFDNSAHAQRLGVGLELLPRHYSGKSAAEAIDALLGSTSRVERCREIAQRAREDDGAVNAAERIIAAVGGDLTAAPGVSKR